jgi:hypothetical protein
MIQLFNWFRRGSLERGLDRELQYHFDRRVADLTAADIPEPEARRRVAVELGLTRVREDVRDVWLTRWLRDFLYDLRYSARSLRRSPGFTAVALLSLALGIGATTAIYSLVDQVILHALPVRDPGSLVLVDWNADELITGAIGSFNLMPRPACRELQQQTRFLDGVLCRAEIEVNLTAGGDPRPVAAEIVSGSYFSVLGVAPALGRVIEPEDDAAPGGGPVVVLAYDFWQAHFGGAADIVGRKVLVGNRPMTVVGVAAAGFRGVDVGAVPAFWMPTSMYADSNQSTSEDLFNGPERWLQILARLRPGVSAAQAQTGLLTWFRPWLEDSTRRPGFPVITAEKLRLYLTSSLIVTPAPQGTRLCAATFPSRCGSCSPPPAFCSAWPVSMSPDSFSPAALHAAARLARVSLSAPPEDASAASFWPIASFSLSPEVCLGLRSRRLPCAPSSPSCPTTWPPTRCARASASTFSALRS